MEPLEYEEFRERLGLANTDLVSLIYTLYKQALLDEERKDSPDYGQIYRTL